MAWMYATYDTRGDSITQKLISGSQVAIQCEQKKVPPEVIWHLFPNGWEFLVQILHTYYTFLSMLEYKFLFNYVQLWRSYAILSATTQRIFTFH